MVGYTSHLLTRDGGEKRVTMELIGTLAGGDPARVEQAQAVVMNKLWRPAESTLTIGTPVRPTSQQIEAEAQRAATVSVTGPEQARRITTTNPGAGGRPSHGVNKGKRRGPVRWITSPEDPQTGWQHGNSQSID